MTELLGIPFSPWTAKARWALDARRVPYTFRVYQPLFGEPALRLKLRRFTGRVSVPVLTTDDGRVLPDSADIARWADEHGDGPRLFPREHEAEIARYTALSERALASARALSLERMLDDNEALMEMVPRPARRVLGSFAPRASKLGVERLLRKYDAHLESSDAHRRTVLGALDEIRAALAKNPSTMGPQAAPNPGAPSGPPCTEGPRTLLGAFTFADIAMAQILTFVEVPASVKLGPASRRVFSDASLREPYADLVGWRDELRRVYWPT